MNCSKNRLKTTLVFLAIALTSCTAPSLKSQNPAVVNTASSLTPSNKAAVNDFWNANQSKSNNTTSVTIYKADSQCETFVPETVTVPVETPVQGAIKEVLDWEENGDFSLAGYRVRIDPKSRIATVDLRLAPDSKRKFVSLSTCEQFALFGSLRKTLISNSQWKIKDVRFTEKGQAIFL